MLNFNLVDPSTLATVPQVNLLESILSPSFKVTTERMRLRVQRLLVLGLIEHPKAGVLVVSRKGHRILKAGKG